MITPKVNKGSIVYFAKDMTFDYFGDDIHFMIVVKGEVTKVYNSDKFRVRWVDDDGVIHNEDIPLKKIGSFEWGGIVVSNSKRDKKIFDSLGF